MPWEKKVNEVIDIALDFADKLAEGERIDAILEADVFEGWFSRAPEFDLSGANTITVTVRKAENVQESTFMVPGAGRAILYLALGPLTRVEGVKVPGSEGADRTLVGFRVQGGTPGKTYTVRMRIRTELGNVREKEDTLRILV